MTKGDTIYINNDAGRLEIFADYQLRNYSGFFLGKMSDVRVEYHKNSRHEMIVTIYDNDQSEVSEDSPNKIYVLFIENQEMWECHFNKSEEYNEHEYSTIK